MKQENGLSTDWFRAVNLCERIASLRAESSHKVFDGEANREPAGQLLERWRSQPHFAREDSFAQRLALDNLSEDEFLSLLGEPLELLRQRYEAAPRWMTDLLDSFSRASSSSSSSCECVSNLLREIQEQSTMAGFLYLVEPLIYEAHARLREKIRELSRGVCELPFETGTVETLFIKNLLAQLLALLSPTMVLELHVARLEGHLRGETSEERFQSFVERIREPQNALAVLREYPVLARQVMTCLNHWQGFALEFLQHLCADWQEVKLLLSEDGHTDSLLAVHVGAGDAHREGRAVLIAEFASGAKVVYKPHSLSVDSHFQELLQWVNEKGTHPPFRQLRMLARGSYGWVEFVSHQPCADAEAVRRFYQRQGGYLALLYALEAVDFHYENLIAAGEHPVLVDLEALFHMRAEHVSQKEPGMFASKVINHSVLRIGLLPQRLWSNSESDGVDLSGLGASANQTWPHEVPYWSESGTDEMRLARQQTKLSGGKNRPSIEGAEVNLLDYSDALVDGFTSVYRLLMLHRDELLTEHGPLARFAADEVRVIIRATKNYAQLLYKSFHPNLLRNALERDLFFDNLWAGVEAVPSLARVIPSELEDLRRGDIPVFTTRPSARDLWDSSQRRIADFFSESGWSLVSSRLQSLSEPDLEQQLWFINASLTSLSIGLNGPSWPGYRLPEMPPAEATRERLLAAACKVGERLETLALRAEDEVAWIGLNHVKERYWAPMPLGADLYGGLMGISLFLAYLGAQTCEERYTALADAAVQTALRQLKRLKASIKSVGGFSGWGGVIYGLVHLGALWNQSSLLDEAKEIVGLLPDLIEQDEELDVIGGSAGCLAALLVLHQCSGSKRAQAVARQCGERLLASAQPMAQGVGWLTRIAPQRPLTGFSHGAAGIAWALLRLWNLTGDERFLRTAQAGMLYERSLFSSVAGNWPDLRENAGAENDEKEHQSVEEHERLAFMVAWCHGAAGIGLARLQSLQYLSDDNMRAELDAALAATCRQGFGLNHSLCHGDLGNIELLLQSGEIFPASPWRVQVESLTARILESLSREGWLCGTPSGVETPGLMAGLAGIGLGLLRLAEPALIPSVLTLSTPTQTCFR